MIGISTPTIVWDVREALEQFPIEFLSRAGTSIVLTNDLGGPIEYLLPRGTVAY